MSTTLPLFWNLSSASKKERIDASVKLIGALEQFQAQLIPKESSSGPSEEDDNESPTNASQRDRLELRNSQDVIYSIRRLIRGLASPRESSRLGFAVALTELLYRLDTVTSSQIAGIVIQSSQTQGSMSGQEERDVFFARLFGLTSIIQSGLVVRTIPLKTSGSTPTHASTLEAYKGVIHELVVLGEKKSWLRQSCWWSLALAIDALHTSIVSWREEAIDYTVETIFEEYKQWSPEKIGLAVKLQTLYPSKDWTKHFEPTFKHSDILGIGNLHVLARILKESTSDDEDGANVPKAATSSWNPEVHFVWDIILDNLLPVPGSPQQPRGSLQDFFRIVVDESLFSSTSSPQRKYWGFQIFQKALPRASALDIPMLFTKNFMRSWINHLSNHDRYLHKIARQVAIDIQGIVEKNPTTGFTLVLQLTGVHGNRQFDKLTKTKTIESVLVSMDIDGIKSYIEHLLGQVNEEDNSETFDTAALDSRRVWIIDQLAALIRNGAVPKSDDWIQMILNWFVVNGLFSVKKKSQKSVYHGVRCPPKPVFSDALRKSCRERLLSSLAELTSQALVLQPASTDDKGRIKTTAIASDGDFWISKALGTITTLNDDTKHVQLLTLDIEDTEDMSTLLSKVKTLIERLHEMSGQKHEAASGAELLLSASLLQFYCSDKPEERDTDSLKVCVDSADHMFPLEAEHKKKRRKNTSGLDDATGEHLSEPEPIDVLVDTIIGYLEKSTAYMRAVANHVFGLLSGEIKESTIDLILTQLERRNPAPDIQEIEDEDEGEEEEDEEEDGEDEDEDDHNTQGSDVRDDDDDDDDDEESVEEAPDPELRQRIAVALHMHGIEGVDSDSDESSNEELMDDEQMMAIDEQLAAVFRSQKSEKRTGKGVDAQREATHFKNRVLDLVELFVKKQSSNALVLRFVLPLVDLIAGSGSDEKQLVDKATGVLRSRLAKSKELPSNVEVHEICQLIRTLHGKARKAHSAELLTTMSQCSLYFSRLLLQCGVESVVLEVYRESLIDFVTRKNSSLNANFFLDFIHRHPVVAWKLRDDILTVLKKSANVYRQCQALQMFQPLLNQLQNLHDEKTIIKVMSSFRQETYDILSDACDEIPTLNAGQVKDVLKLATLAVRQTKRVSTSPEVVSKVWKPEIWIDLGGKFKATDRFRASSTIHKMCRQVGEMARAPSTTPTTTISSSGDALPAKRKMATSSEVGDAAPSAKKIKRNRVKTTA